MPVTLWLLADPGTTSEMKLLYSVAGFLNDRIATADAEGVPNSLLPSYDIAIVYRVQHMGSEGLEPPTLSV